MKVDRRDIFKFAGGAAAGLVLTPLPWKLLDDSAIWTQNWPWIPKPLKGEIRTKFSNCTLCPNGCGVRARCVGDQPVSLSGVSGHPVGCGALCAAGLVGHHLAYHPARLRRALRQGQTTTIDEAAKAVATAVSTSSEHIAILDGRPGRAVSIAYRDWLAQFPKGLHLQPYRATLEVSRLDLENTRTLLSFGTPLLDGYCTPGRIAQARRQLRLIQAEPRQSRTALLADVWLPIKPGTEAVLARGLAQIIKRETASVGEVAQITGLTPQIISDAAMILVNNGPAVVIGGGDPAAGPLSEEAQQAIASLNVALGATGVEGNTQATEFAAVADHSIEVLIIDANSMEATLPAPFIKRKLSANPLVLSLSAFANGYASFSEYVIPTPAHFETIEDIPTPFAIAQPLYPAPEGVVEPAVFLAKVSETAGLKSPPRPETLQRARAEAIRKTGQGSLFNYADGQSTPVKDAGSEEDFWKALCAGACWIDDKAPAKLPARAASLDKPASHPRLHTEFPLALVPFGWSNGPAQSSPLMTKLYQESNLRESPNAIRVNPETAAEAGLKDGDAAIVETLSGSIQGKTGVNAAVMPGVVEVAADFTVKGVLDVCAVDPDGSWRNTATRIRRA